jgi:ribosomal protein S18 acetylase RimI-like enzyme
MLTIERAEAEDVEAIRQVLSETWVATYADHLSASTIEQVATNWHDAGMLRSQILQSGVYFAVAKVDGRIVGLITVLAVNREELLLSRLYVLPAYQGKGIGSGLLNAATASHPEAKSIRLAVEQQNARARSFWRGHGFADTGASTERVGDDSIAVVTMERWLR